MVLNICVEGADGGMSVVVLPSLLLELMMIAVVDNRTAVDRLIHGWMGGWRGGVMI